ncbi:MAG: hypothetical protein AAF846_02730 [Chloroflexota bacterium]
MPYEVNWLIENQIVHVRFWGESTTEQFRSALTKITAMQHASDRDYVHTITDSTAVTMVLPFQESIKVLREFEATKNDGWEIVVGPMTSIMRISLSISRSLLRMKAINFRTTSEALAHLKEQDASLNWYKLDRSLLDDSIKIPE